MFDTSNSFIKATLESYISEKFVENHISYYEVSETSLPVNIWNTTLYHKHIDKKRYISSLILALFNNVTSNQRSAVNNAISKTLNEATDNIFNINRLIEILNDECDSNVVRNISETIELINEELNDYNVNEGLTWDDILNDRKVIIIAFPYDSSSNSNRITDMLLSSLYSYQNSLKKYEMRIFIDEIQKQNLEQKSPIHTILTEGRKFQIGLNFASQFVSNRSTAENQMKNNTSVTVYFKPDDVSKKTVIERLALDEKQQEILDNFKPGDCFVKGSLYNFRTKSNENTIIYGKVKKQT